MTRSVFPGWRIASADAPFSGAAGRRGCWIRNCRTTVWPQAVLDDLTPKNLPDGRKGYFRQSSDQIGVTETNDFIFGDLHRAMRKQLFDGLCRPVTDAMDLGDAAGSSGGRVWQHARDNGRLSQAARYRSIAQSTASDPDTPQ